MAVKILGQVEPSATTATALYTAGTGKVTVVSTITVCNKAASSGTYRLAVRENGDTLADKHYLVYDAALAAKGSDFLTIGLCVTDGDVVEVYASSADFSFSAFGDET